MTKTERGTGLPEYPVLFICDGVLLHEDDAHVQKRDYDALRQAAELRLKELERDVNDLNNVLRAAGWGQGEIDSAAEMLYKAEERASKLVDALRTVQPYFEGEHAYDHPHCVLIRAAIDAALAEHKGAEG